MPSSQEDEMPLQFQLKMQSGPTPGKTFPVEGNVAVVGRESGNAVIIGDPEISRKHARFTRQGESYVIEDLGSTNGTFVNQNRLTAPYMLKQGDIISFGEQINLIFEVIADPNQTMVSPMKPSPSVPVPPPMSSPMPMPSTTPLTTNPAAVQYNPETPPAYAGQVPAGPPTYPIEEGKKPDTTTRTIIVIAVIAVLLCCICGCIGLLWFIDSNNLWCQWVPWLVPLLGGNCG
jgi:pSer/pThr/pTyr-binding forkhead associated (FHA) protein